MTWWQKLFASRVFILIGALALAMSAFLLYLRYVQPWKEIYVPGPTSVQTVYVPKWRGKVKPEVRLLPTNTAIEFLPRDQVVKASKIEDAPENIIAVGQVPPHAGRSTVFATLEAGKDNVLRGALQYRQEAVSFWEMKREIHGGIYYGVAGKNLAEGQVRINFLRTGPVNWNGQGRVGIERDGGGMNGALLVGIEY